MTRVVSPGAGRPAHRWHLPGDLQRPAVLLDPGRGAGDATGQASAGGSWSAGATMWSETSGYGRGMGAMLDGNALVAERCTVCHARAIGTAARIRPVGRPLWTA